MSSAFLDRVITEWFDYCFVNCTGDYKSFVECYGNILDEKRYNELMDKQTKQYDHYAQFSIHN